MAAVSNRFTVMSLLEDLVQSSDAADRDGVVAARTKALKHLPSLAKTLGDGWAHNEIEPFLLHCAAEDEPPVVCEIARLLPSFAKHPHYFPTAALQAVTAALAASSSKECRRVLCESVPTAMLATDAARAPVKDSQQAQAGLLYAEFVASGLRNAAWPASRATMLRLACAPALIVHAAREASGEEYVRDVDDFAVSASNKYQAAARGAPEKAQFEWLVAAELPRCALDAAVRTIISVCVVDGRGSAPDRRVELLCSRDPTSVGASTAKALESLRELAIDIGVLSKSGACTQPHAERLVNASVALLNRLCKSVAEATLTSPVPWAVEAALLQLPALLRALALVATVAVGRDAAKQRAGLAEVARNSARALLAATGELACHEDFRTRLLIARHLAAIAAAGAGFEQAAHLANASKSVGVDAFVTQALGALVQDPDSDVRCEAAAAIRGLTSQLSDPACCALRRPDTDTLDAAALQQLVGLCDALRGDPVAFTREAVAPAIADLARASPGTLEGRDRQALYSMLIELLRDEAANVRMAAAVGLSDCVAIVGRRQAERDLVEAVEPLVAHTTQWRAREVLARGLPRVLEVFVLPPKRPAAAEAAGPAVLLSPRRALFSGDEEGANTQASAAATGADEGGKELVRLIARLLLDSAKAVRDAALEAVCAAALRVYRRVDSGDFAAITLDGVVPGGGGEGATDGPDLVVFELLAGALWPAVRDHEGTERHYLLRAAQLRIAAAFALPLGAELIPLLQRRASDAVVNVRRSVALVVADLLDHRADATTLDALAARDDQDAAACAMASGRLVVLGHDVASGPLLQLVRQLCEDASPDVREVAAVALASCH